MLYCGLAVTVIQRRQGKRKGLGKIEIQRVVALQSVILSEFYYATRGHCLEMHMDIEAF